MATHRRQAGPRRRTTGPSPTVRRRGPDAARIRAEVLRGLRRRPKDLPCKYFYDELGSRLFEDICELDEYYLTRAELAIMRRHAGAMAATIGPRCCLIEFGSGSSRKTRLLLDHLEEPAAYVPIDISEAALEASARALTADYPGLDVLPVCADFTRPFDLPELPPAARRAVYFPGSTVGNFGPAAAGRLLRRIRRLCGRGGGLLIGYDLKKDPAVLNAAYNDSRGVTAEFNLNLLRHINRELGADFQLDGFRHLAFYNAEQGRIEMHLVCTRPQTVHIGRARVDLAEGETIRTEYSYKYAVAEFSALAEGAGLRPRQAWTDAAGLFCVQYLAAP